MFGAVGEDKTWVNHNLEASLLAETSLIVREIHNFEDEALNCPSFLIYVTPDVCVGESTIYCEQFLLVRSFRGQYPQVQ
jgi:hypothetical protein